MNKFRGKFIVDKNGKKTAVVLPVEEYEELLEDIHDLAIVAERRDEYTVSFKELKKRLKKDGLL
jgi:PHD/YefM family antitoxin component YafN of YafNO toxin-antitoxin module